MSLVKTYDLDMSPGGVPLIIHLSQYDEDFKLVFNLYSSDGELDIESGTTAAIRGTKSDRNGFSASEEIEGESVTVTGDQQITAAAGRNVYELTLYNSEGKEINTQNFVIEVERAALDKGTSVSASKLMELEVQLVIRKAKEASESAAEALASQNAAKASEEAALSSQNASKASEDAAKQSETNAADSEKNAKASEEAAMASQNAAKESETNAKASENASKASEDAAKLSETNSKVSEDKAKASEEASLASQNAAKDSEEKALESEQAALASQNSAKESETNAAESEKNAKASEEASLSSQNAAKESETNAKASETAAGGSADSSASSALLSESWAVGGTKSRDGENSKNSKFYAEESSNSAAEALVSQKAAADSAADAATSVQKINGVMKYAGTVSSVAELPTSNLSMGDVWRITETEAEYYWDGSVWRMFGPKVKETALVVPSSDWKGENAPFTYDLGEAFKDKVLLVGFNSTGATEEQSETASSAQILGGTGTILYAWGDKPEIDIPIIVLSFEGGES